MSQGGGRASGGRRVQRVGGTERKRRALSFDRPLRDGPAEAVSFSQLLGKYRPGAPLNVQQSCPFPSRAIVDCQGPFLPLPVGPWQLPKAPLLPPRDGPPGQSAARQPPRGPPAPALCRAAQPPPVSPQPRPRPSLPRCPTAPTPSALSTSCFGVVLLPAPPAVLSSLVRGRHCWRRQCEPPPGGEASQAACRPFAPPPPSSPPVFCCRLCASLSSSFFFFLLWPSRETAAARPPLLPASSPARVCGKPPAPPPHVVLCIHPCRHCGSRPRAGRAGHGAPDTSLAGGPPRAPRA